MTRVDGRWRHLRAPRAPARAKYSSVQSTIVQVTLQYIHCGRIKTMADMDMRRDYGGGGPGGGGYRHGGGGRNFNKRKRGRGKAPCSKQKMTFRTDNSSQMMMTMTVATQDSDAIPPRVPGSGKGCWKLESKRRPIASQEITLIRPIETLYVCRTKSRRTLPNLPLRTGSTSMSRISSRQLR